MRKDETGQPCPETLGEYLDLCQAIAPESRAVKLLEDKIAESPHGRKEKVLAADSQMRYLLMPLLTDPDPAPGEQS